MIISIELETRLFSPMGRKRVVVVVVVVVATGSSLDLDVRSRPPIMTVYLLSRAMDRNRWSFEQIGPCLVAVRLSSCALWEGFLSLKRSVFLFFKGLFLF